MNTDIDLAHITAEPARVRLVRGAHPSMRAAVCQAIRADILSGHLRPGTRIGLKAISLQPGVTVSILREALCQLAADGLVNVEEQRGFWVAPVSMSDLRDLVQRRIEVETSALRLSIANGDSEWESQVVAAGHKLARTPKFTPEWPTQHRLFHDALVAACGSQWLLRFHGMLHESSERYRQLASTSGMKTDLDAEHRALAEAAVDRNVDRSMELMTKHVSDMSYILLRSGFAQE